MPDSTEQLMQILRAKAGLLVQREQEIAMLRSAQERTTAWLHALDGLSRSLRADQADTIYADWTERMIRELSFQAAAVYRSDRPGDQLQLVLGQSPAGLPHLMSLPTEVVDYLLQRPDGLCNQAASPVLVTLSALVNMSHFLWHRFAIDGSMVLLVAGFNDVSSADAEEDLAYLRRVAPPDSQMPGRATEEDLEYSRMLAHHVALLVHNSHLFDRLKSDRVELQALNERYARANELLAQKVAELVQARERLLSAENYLNLVLASAQDGILSLDSRGHCLLANPAALSMLGKLDTLLPLTHIHTVVHRGAEHGAEDCPLLPDLAPGAAQGTSVDEFFRADGGRFPVEYSSSPLVEEGVRVGVVVVFRDITVRQELARMQDEFISTVSHELRTPLTSIRGSLGLLNAGLFGKLIPKGQRMLELAVANTDRLVRLINDILDMEKLQAGRMIFEAKPVSVSHLLRGVVDGLQGMADQFGVSLCMDSREEQVTADPDRVLQVLTNLVGNAIKFSQEGGTVKVSTAPCPAGIRFSVSDTGRGIPSDQLAHIFGRFHQVDSSDARERGGTGLGLAIAKAIVVQHGGDMWVESEPGVGSTFSFTLPLLQPGSGGSSVRLERPG